MTRPFVGQPGSPAQDILRERIMPRNSLQRLAKRLMDLLGASVFFILFGWMFVLVWIGVLWTTGAPAIYRHSRIGRAGKAFPCLKFRSMVNNSDQVLKQLLDTDAEARAEWNSNFKLKNDPRITRFGRFIRKTSLDELPQFWNVMMGDMSLVGPRPVTHKELETYYGNAAQIYSQVRPGITGPWQVGGRSDIGYSDRVKLDTDYAATWSLAGDVKILAQTVGAVLLRRGSY